MTIFTLADGRRAFHQWDTGRQLIVHDPTCTEVHFCNSSSDCSLVCEVFDLDGQRVVNVPNILLQSALPITAFAFVDEGEGGYTRRAVVFAVRARTKPEAYVYTETEVLNYSSLVSRIDQIERNGVSDEQIATAVEKYLEENPIDGLPEVSAVDEGKILRVTNGDWAVVELPVYSGDYAVTPKADESTTLPTAQKYMTQNVNVKKIPYYEVDNAAGGSTIYIGTDDEIIIE